MGGGPRMKEIVGRVMSLAETVLTSEQVQRRFRTMVLRDLAVREFTCPKCGATPSAACKNWLRFTTDVHDARLTAALLVYGDFSYDAATDTYRTR